MEEISSAIQVQAQPQPQNKKTFNRRKMAVSKGVGYSISITSMGVTAIAVFFPSSATLMILGVNPDLTITISVVNIATKLALGLYLSIQTNMIFSNWYAENNRPPLTCQDIVKNTGIIVGSIPLVGFFCLVTKVSIDTFLANVANQTATNNTAQLPPLFFHVANATKLPGVQGTFIAGTGVFNWIGNYFVIVGSAGVVCAMKSEYQEIISRSDLSPEQVNKMVCNYQADVWGGLSLVAVVGGWGNAPYILLGGDLYSRYLSAPYGVGIFMGVIQYLNMMLLSFLTMMPFGKDVTKVIRLTVTGKFKLFYEEALREKEKMEIAAHRQFMDDRAFVVIAITKGTLATVLVGCGALYSVFNAIYLMLNLPTTTMAGISGSLQEVAVVYLVLSILFNWGRDAVNGLIKCCQPEEQEEILNALERGHGREGSELAPPVQENTLENGGWEASARAVTPDGSPSSGSPAKTPKSSLEEFKSDTPSPAPEENITVTWGQWFGSFFRCCDGSRGKNPLSPIKRNSGSPLLTTLTGASQPSSGNVTSSVPILTYQGQGARM